MIIIPEDVLRIAEALSASIEELGLSARSYNGLRRWGITTVADVYRAYEDKQLPRIRNLGEKSVIEIEKHLEEHLAKVAPANNSEIPNSSDTISRQQATDTLRGYLVGKRCPDDGTLTCRLIENEVINKLPPAQPAPSQVAADIARIVENGKDMRVIEAAQPTPDQNGDLWITVPDIDKVTCIYVQESKSKFCRIFYEEQEQPEPFTSKWIPIGIADAVGGESAMWGDKIAYHVCEKCWKQALERDGEEVLSDFCPNCGADMRGEQDE